MRSEATLGATPAWVDAVMSSGALSDATKQLLPRLKPPETPVSWIFNRARMSTLPVSGSIVPVQSAVGRIVTLMTSPPVTSWSGGNTICAFGNRMLPLESTVPRSDGFGRLSATKSSLKTLAFEPTISR